MTVYSTYSSGPGLYLQGQDVLEQIGQHAARLGSRCLIVAGRTAWQQTERILMSSLTEQKMTCSVFQFSGYCTDRTISQVVESAQSGLAQMIMAVGGGRCIDTAKSAAFRAGLPCITIPTVASTCSCYTTLSVIYDEQGAHLYNEQCGDIIRATLVDSRLLARHSPVRMIRAGIADALAKLPEIEYGILQDTTGDTGPAVAVAHSLARQNQLIFTLRGPKAIDDLQEGQVTDDVEAILMTSLAMTGICSQLSNGFRQLALAHAFYDAVCHGFKPSRCAYLHGELVACGIPLQQLANNSPAKDKEEMEQLLVFLDMPRTLAAIGIEKNRENLTRLSAYMASHADSAGPGQQVRIMQWLQTCYPD